MVLFDVADQLIELGQKSLLVAVALVDVFGAPLEVCLDQLLESRRGVLQLVVDRPRQSLSSSLFVVLVGRVVVGVAFISGLEREKKERKNEKEKKK